MPTITPVFGMQGTGRWDTDENPGSWRQELLRNYPRGGMILTAMQSKMGKEEVGGPIFHWWEKDLITNAGDIPLTDAGGFVVGAAAGSIAADGAIFTNDTLLVAADYETTYSAWNAAVGTVLYVRIDTAASDPVTNYLVVGADILLTNDADYRIATRATVLAIERGNASNLNYIKIRLLTADTGVDATSLMHANRILVLPTTFPEFGGVPSPLAWKPGSFYNYTTIKKASASMSRTAMSNKNIRPSDNSWAEVEREALEALGIQMEYDLLFGVRLEQTDSVTNQLIRRSMGIRQYISTYGLAANIASYKYDTLYSGKTWLQGGFEWLMNKAKDLSVYCDLNTTLHVVGNGVKMGLALLAHKYATVQLTPTVVEYGINVTRLTTPFGDFNLIDHPLFNREASLQYSWVGIPRGSMIYHTLSDPEYGTSDIRLLKDPGYGKGGLYHVDGQFNLWLVEYGYEFHNSKAWFWLNDVGRDNVV